MAMDLKEIEKHIKEALPDALVEIQDLAGDGLSLYERYTRPTTMWLFNDCFKYS